MNKKKPVTRKKAAKKKRSILARIFNTLLLSAIFCAILVGLFVCCVYYGMWGKIPDYRDLREIRNSEASSLYSEDGELLGKYYVENRTNVMFGGDIPECRERTYCHRRRALLRTSRVRQGQYATRLMQDFASWGQEFGRWKHH